MWPRRVELTQHEAPLPGLPADLDGLRVVQLSDLHVGFYSRAGLVRRGVSLANSLKPDLVVLTGDFANCRSERVLRESAQELTALQARRGVFACLGNHDHWEDVEQIQAALDDVGVRVLVNENAEVASGLWLAAVDDLMAGEPDLDAAMAGLPEQAAVVLLSHNALILPQVADKPWLVLSGHSHGGQIAVPFLGPRRTARLPGARWLMWAYEAFGARFSGGRVEAVSGYLYPEGWYEQGRARMYVNRGLGTSQTWPIRVGCPPEIACFTLRQDDARER